MHHESLALFMAKRKIIHYSGFGCFVVRGLHKAKKPAALSVWSERPQARGLGVLVLMVGSRTRGRNDMAVSKALRRTAQRCVSPIRSKCGEKTALITLLHDESPALLGAETEGPHGGGFGRFPARGFESATVAAVATPAQGLALKHQRIYYA